MTTGIALFVIEKMGSYIAGGMKPETAAHYTRGELLAIYMGDHYSRDAAGQLSKTTPPEALDTETAMEKADEALAEVLNCCAQSAVKGPTMNAETERAETHGRATEGPALKRNGFEKLAEYARNTA